MQKQKSEYNLLHPIEIYLTYLAKINHVSLTMREVDVLSCLVNGRSTKGIANFLSLSPKTVASHIYNASNKFGCDTDGMMVLLAKSERSHPLQEYYRALLTNAAFQEALDGLKQLLVKADNQLECRFVYWEKKPPFLESVRNDLTRAGFTVVLEGRKESQSIDELLLEVYRDRLLIYFLPDSFVNQMEASPTLPNAKDVFSQKVFFFPLLKDFPTLPDALSKVSCIKPSEWSNYYSSIFSLLKSNFPKVDMDLLIQQFEEKAKTSSIRSLSLPKYPLENPDIKETADTVFQRRLPLISKKAGYALSVVLSVLLMGFLWNFKPHRMLMITESYHHHMGETTSLQAGLEIPSEDTLLNRVNLIRMIDKGFQKQESGIKTIALFGMGGSGKTTLARQYAYRQNPSVVWEVNAEKSASLLNSLLALSYALCKKDEEKQLLVGVTKIHDLTEKIEKFMNFLKAQLKQHPNWILIYDNVENMREIQEYFPLDANGWGVGKVIVTTQDNHIQNNGYIKDVVSIGQLSDEEKLSLFTKVMNRGDKKISLDPQLLKGFLEKIPSFPLDISTAAYYMKATDTDPDQYLDYLANYGEDFSKIQKDIVAESTGCQKTRYHIITLALEKLVAADKNFGDLLLFISLLDSKNIPRFLLERYKGKLAVDQFIYALKKYSLINIDNLKDSSVGQSFSVHQSVQEVARIYLLKKDKTTEDYKAIAAMTKVMETCAEDSIDNGDYFDAFLLLNHINAFLNHSSHFPSKIKHSLSCQLGGLYFYLGNYERALEILEENQENLNRDRGINYLQTAKNLIYLANTLRHLGQLDKSRNLLEQGLSISKKHLPENHEIIARSSIYLGVVFKKLRSYDNAKHHLIEGIRLYNKHLPENYTGIAQAKTYLGNTYQALGLLHQAESSLKQALDIYRKKQPLNYVGIGWTLTYLGSVYRDLGNLDKAMNMLQESLTMYKKCLPDDHTKVSWVFEKIGLVHKDLGNYSESRKYFEMALLNYQNKYGGNHLKVERMRKYIEDTNEIERMGKIKKRSL